MITMRWFLVEVMRWDDIIGKGAIESFLRNSLLRDSCPMSNQGKERYRDRRAKIVSSSWQGRTSWCPHLQGCHPLKKGRCCSHQCWQYPKVLGMGCCVSPCHTPTGRSRCGGTFYIGSFVLSQVLVCLWRMVVRQRRKMQVVGGTLTKYRLYPRYSHSRSLPAISVVWMESPKNI
jgi:hypothetical protein